ncbi:Oidioi.mRNA.OKI2018_I69.XSR.g15671.t1.cds [Oikopleura dioica]|uniref:Oidioi.mRNA.OKI2018_I69.XSR.g15671.t1.cds n=1 Tax=Oikopleura dioica TaxID=34765 RepID=A0ABN7SDM1_OIKDI|nr:Oidioi.mRNA.OKI2018_I69.XSR.g15671.t1.cds [Oikopleura dioica]
MISTEKRSFLKRIVSIQRCRKLHLSPREELYYETREAPINRSDFAVGVHRGKVYVYGGVCVALGHGLSDLYEYDPATESWTELRKRSAPGRLIDVDGRGRVPLRGQRHLIGDSDEFWKFSPKFQKWTKLASGPPARSEAGIAYYQQNVLVVGGYQTSDIWGYHTSLGVWTQWMKSIPKCISENIMLWEDSIFSVSNSKLGCFLYVINLNDRKYSFTTHSLEKAVGSKMVTIGTPASEFRSRSTPGSGRRRNRIASRKNSRSKVGIFNDGFEIGDDASFVSSPAPESVDSAYSSSPEPYRSSSLLNQQSSPVLPFAKKLDQVENTGCYFLIFGGKPLHPVYTRKPLYAGKINLPPELIP